MSTLKTTNIAHPSSASNNIVLDSSGGVNLDALTVSGSAPADSVNIDASGRLLVGTFSSSAAASLVCQGTSASSTAGTQIWLQRGQAAASIGSGDTLGRINFADNAGNAYAIIEGATDASGGANDYPGRLTFSATADGASSPTERMRITNDGAVLIGSSTSSLNNSTNKVKFAVGGTGNAHTPTRGVWMSGTIPASTTYTVELGYDQPSGFLVLTIASDPYAPTQPWSATSTQTQLYLVVPVRGGAAGGSKTLVSSISRGTPHGTIVWGTEGTIFTIQNTSGSAPLWYEVQYRI